MAVGRGKNSLLHEGSPLYTGHFPMEDNVSKTIWAAKLVLKDFKKIPMGHKVGRGRKGMSPGRAG